MRIPVIPHNSIDSVISMIPIVSHQIKKNGFSALRKIPAKNGFLLGFLFVLKYNKGEDIASCEKASNKLYFESKKES